MQTVLIAGGSGLVGRTLSKMLIKRGYHVIILSRKMPLYPPADSSIEFALWDIENACIDKTALQKADHIIQLAGAGVVDKSWTKNYKKLILESRTKSCALLVNNLQKISNSVKTVVSASAIGWYGTDPIAGNSNGFKETASPADNFLGETCKLWEESIEPVTQLGKRLVKLRMGIVLSNEGGALAEFKKPVRFGIAGILGSGKQMISWIHIDDLCRLYIEAIENTQLNGSYNAVAPAPVTNKTLTIELAKTMKGRFYIPVHIPAFLLQLVLGKRSIEILKSTTACSEKIQQAGFKFLYPNIEAALKQLCGNKIKDL